MHTYINTGIHTHIHYTNAYAYAYESMYICRSILIHIHAEIYVDTLYIYVYIYICSPPHDTQKCTFCTFIHNNYLATTSNIKKCRNAKTQNSKNPKNARFRRCEKFWTCGLLGGRFWVFGFLDFWFLVFWILRLVDTCTRGAAFSCTIGARVREYYHLYMHYIHTHMCAG